MTREIKFWAVNKENGDIYHELSIKDIMKGMWRREPLHKLEIMQDTGLKDKSGKPIFEGYIVKNQNMEGQWINYKIIFDKDDARFLGISNSESYNIGAYQIKKSVVIGNIYENPELLSNIKE